MNMLKTPQIQFKGEKKLLKKKLCIMFFEKSSKSIRF